MKNFKLGLLAFLGALSIIGCGSDDNTEVFDTSGDGDVTVPVALIDLTRNSDETVDGTFFATVEGEAGGTVKGRVKYTAIGKSMKRLYITETLPGGEPHPYELMLEGKQEREATKPDGSIDLDDDKKEAFDFSFDLKVPNDTAGEIVYNFWATSGRGDFRDPSKRLLVGVGTIDVKVGTTAVDQDLIQQDNLVLSAPLGDGNSKTFTSFFDLSQTYFINQGAEFSTLWDFGYFYGNTLNASLASANNYPSNIVDIVTLSNAASTNDDIVASDLKKVYFVKNNSIDFNSVTTLAELNTLITNSFSVSTSSGQRVTGLSAGDVIEFEDQSGRKGLIKVVSIAGTDGTTGKITLSVKATAAKPIMNDGAKFLN